MINKCTALIPLLIGIRAVIIHNIVITAIGSTTIYTYSIIIIQTKSLQQNKL